jgi:hypothetical protein
MTVMKEVLAIFQGYALVMITILVKTVLIKDALEIVELMVDAIFLLENATAMAQMVIMIVCLLLVQQLVMDYAMLKAFAITTLAFVNAIVAVLGLTALIQKLN